jgi:hypothetical protein
LRRLAAALGLAFGIEAAVGLLIVVAEHTVWLHTLYATAAATLWALLVVVTARAG